MSIKNDAPLEDSALDVSFPPQISKVDEPLTENISKSVDVQGPNEVQQQPFPVRSTDLVVGGPQTGPLSSITTQQPAQANTPPLDYSEPGPSRNQFSPVQASTLSDEFITSNNVEHQEPVNVHIRNGESINNREAHLDSGRVTNTIFGKMRKSSSLPSIALVFFALMTTSVIICIGVAIHHIAVLENTSDDFTFAILLFVTAVFGFCFGLHGLFFERPYEIISSATSALVIVVYAIIGFIDDPNKETTMDRLIGTITVGLGVFVTGCLTFFEEEDQALLIYRNGRPPERDMREWCKTLFRTYSLLRLDLFIEASLLIFTLRNGLNLGHQENVVLTSGSIYVVCFIIFGTVSLKEEIKFLAYFFCLLSLLEPVFIFYRFSTLEEEDSKVLRYSAMICGVLGILIRLGVMISFGFALKNFSRGVKQYLYGSPYINESTRLLNSRF